MVTHAVGVHESRKVTTESVSAELEPARTMRTLHLSRLCSGGLLLVPVAVYFVLFEYSVMGTV